MTEDRKKTRQATKMEKRKKEKTQKHKVHTWWFITIT